MTTQAIRMSDDYDDGWDDGFNAAFKLRPMSEAEHLKDGRRLLLTDGQLWYVASWMTAMEDGSGAWVIARKLALAQGEEGFAFIVKEPVGFIDLPLASECKIGATIDTSQIAT